MFNRLWKSAKKPATNAQSQATESSNSASEVKSAAPVGDIETLESRLLLSTTLQSPPAHILVTTPAVAKTSTPFSTTPVKVSSAASTTTALTSDASDTPKYGDKITLTAAVTGTSPTGTVTFSDGSTKLGTGTADGSGNWTLATSALAAGSHSITAVYGGDSGNATSTSSALSLTLAKAATTVTWADPADIVYGTALSSTQLNATTGGIAGAVVYSSPVGTVLKAGSSQAITATFTPTSANYAASSATAHINVTAKALTLTGVTANNKVYDSTTAATLVTKSATFTGLVTADKSNVTLDASGVTATFAGADIGKSEAITITGLALSGSAASNYTLTQPAGVTGNITAAPLSVTGLVASDKVYDGTTAATVDASSAALTGVQGSDKIDLDASGLTAAFAKSAVGSKLAVAVSGLALTGDTSSDYTINAPSLTANITAKALTITGVVPANKTYDGATTATLSTGGAALVGVVSADKANVTPVLSKATGTFAHAGIGSGLAVTIAGITLTGSAASNYTITQPSGTARIFAKALTVTGVTAANKTYSGNASASIDASKGALVGLVTADKSNVSIDAGSVTGTFLTTSVGTAIPVAVAGLALKGSAAGNYTLTQPTTTANITAKALTVTGITAADKTYDGTTDASIDGTSAALSGVVGSDDVTLDPSSGTGTFASKNAGSGIVVQIAGLALSGTTAGNYTLTQPTATASITTRAVTVNGVTAADKTYDSTTTATLDFTSADISGVIAADAANAVLSTKSATGAFADANVNSGITVQVAGLALTGSSAANYTVTQPTTPASITAAALTVTGITAADKTYDGATTATLDVSKAALVGIAGKDAVTLDTSNGAGAFADANAGAGKTVSITGLALAGDQAGNYTLTAPTATAKITAAAVTIGGITAANKVYDGTTAATLDATSAALSGVLDADKSNVTLDTSKMAGAFPAASVASGATVKISGLALAGSAAANYSLTAPTATASITTKTLTIIGITAGNKVYDGTTTATLATKAAALAGFVTADKANVTLDVSKATGTFGDANAAKGLTVTVAGATISGSAAGNYKLTQPTTTADITVAPLTVTGIVAADKAYDGTKTATVDAGSAALVGVVSADSSNATLDVSNVTGTFASAGVGTKLTVTIGGLSLTGSAAGNYSITAPTTTAKITAKALTVSGITSADKVYDGTTTATLDVSKAALVGVVEADKANVTLGTGKAAGTFSGAGVGSGLTVTLAGLAITGSAAANYTLTQPTTTASITAKALTITGTTASDKVYDGVNTATLVTKSAALSGLVAADKANVTLDASKAAGTFPDIVVGTGLAVTTSGFALTGSAAANYTLTQPTTTAKITPAPLTVTGIAATGKVYDGNKTATLDASSAALVGVISADSSKVTLDTSKVTGTFASANVGKAVKITVGGLALTGDAAGNYAITAPTATADITAAPVTVDGLLVSDKVYDGTATGTIVATSASLSGVVEADKSNVTLVASKGTATFASANVGKGQDVTIAGLTLLGSAAANYTVTQPSAKGSIAAKALTMTGVTVASKTFDTTTTATADASKAALVGVVTADKSNVTIDASKIAATFASANVGTKIPVTISGIALAGSAAGNYTLTQPTAAADIKTATLTISGLTVTDKTYNGKTNAAVDHSNATVSGNGSDSNINIDPNGVVATFASKTVGTGIKVTVTGFKLTGSNAANYTLAPLSLTGNIVAKTINLTGVTAANKIYDGTTAATLNFNAAHLAGVLASDAAGLSIVNKSATGTFGSANVGKGVSVTIAGITLGGSAAANYKFSQPTATANIKAKALTVTGVTVANKTYDGTAAGTPDASKAVLVGLISADKSNVTVDGSKGAATFATPNVGAAIPALVSGLALSGSAAGNYTLAAPTATATIAPIALTVGGITAADKAFDGTTNATIDTTSAALAGVVDADKSNVTLDSSQAVGTYASSAKASGVTVTVTGLGLTGSAAGDYTITNPTTTASIT